MSLVIDDSGQPVHYPKRRDVFEFDAEVASIFENMAVRSIPAYAETHRVHASIARMYLDDTYESLTKEVCIGDIGASTGVFFKTLCSVYEVPIDAGLPVSCVAIDNSGPMLDRLSDSLPWVTCMMEDATDLHLSNMMFDVMNISYLVQFLSKGTRFNFLKSIAKHMKPGGLLFLSQKENIDNETFDKYFTAEYIQFRMDNGYTGEEIAVKTEALKNSMWVDSFNFMGDMLRGAGFSFIQPTTRWLNFSSLVCIRDDWSG